MSTRQKSSLVLLVLVFFTNCISQDFTLHKQNLVKLFTLEPGTSSFMGYVIVKTGVYRSYLGLANEKDPFTGSALFLAKMNNEGDFDFKRYKIHAPYEFTEGFEKCFSNGSYIIILAGMWPGRKAIIGIYDIEKTTLDKKIVLKDHLFSSVVGAFDQNDNFHISIEQGRQYIKLKKQDNSYIVDTDKDLSGENYHPTNMIINGKPYSSSISSSSMICWKNKLITIYYMMTDDPNSRRNIINYDKIGVQVLNLHNYVYEEFKVYNIIDIASEQINDVEYPKITFYKPGLSQKPIVFVGGKKNDRNHLYKIELDDILQPTLRLQKKSLQYKTAIKNIDFPKDVFWDFAIAHKPNVQYGIKSAIFNVIGFEKKKDKSMAYYYKRIE